MIAIVAALPREIAGLVRGVRPDAELLQKGIHLHVVGDAVIVAGGMGSGRVSHAVSAAMERSAVTELVSVGLAGGCDPRVRAGSVIEASEVVDAQTGERYAVGAGRELAVLVTTSAIASVREKVRLHESYGALMVDMEAATVGRLARAHGLGFRAIKGISDGHDFELESLGRFAGKHGHFRTGAFALHAAVRPHKWGTAMRLGRDSNRALAALTERLLAVMKEHGATS